MKGVQLTKMVQELELNNLTPEIDLSGIVIKTAEINRPALQLTGYLEHFANERVQIIGYVEYTYLMQLNEEERRFKYERFISSKIPCVIFSTMTRPSQDMIDLAVKYNVPTFVTERTTSSFMAEIIRWLGVQLAPCISIHGVLVDVYGEGILITGESGIGKSEAALELIKRGHRLVSDDVVEIRKVSDVTLVGSAPDITRHFIELRGIGIMLGLCYFIQNPTICLIGGFVIGFAGAGGVLQLAVSTTAEFFPENKGTATSMVMIASSVANYTILTLAGYITKTAGTSAPRMILLLNMAVTFIGILLALFVKMNRGKEA